MTLRRRVHALEHNAGKRPKKVLVRHVWYPDDLDAAEAEAERLKGEGFDVHLIVVHRVNREGGDGH